MTTLAVESIELPIIKKESFKSENKKNKYNVELLCDIIERDDCGINVFFYENNCNCFTKIKFICNCGKEGEKTFRRLYQNGGGFCDICVENNAKVKNKQTCLKNLGVEYSFQSGIVKEKSKETNIKKLGVENPMQSEIIKENFKKSCLKNLGVEYPLQSESIRNKGKITCKEKYGFEYAMQSDVFKEKMKIISRTDEYKEKRIKTCINKYNVEHVMQNPEIAEKCLKSCYKLKDYILPSGKILNYQGYENYAIDELLFKENIDEDDILTSRIDVPEIWYYDNKTKRKYYTDIYIKSQNKCIEVKSTYTAENKKDIIKLKEEAVIKAGYKYEIRIYDGKGNRI